MSSSKTDHEKCVHSAYSILVRREHSRQELYWKLRQRETCQDVDLGALMDRLEDDNYLSDERYAEMSVRYGISKGYGPVKIAYRLRKNGVEDYLIQRYLNDDTIDWYTLIHNVRQKRFGIALPNDLKERAKQSRFLAGRGFKTDMIRTELAL